MLSEERLKRIKELEKRSFERGIFTFSDFMSPTSLSEATALLKRGEYSVYGGVSFAERAMIRFGNEEDLGYEEEFPLCVLRITLQGGKFAVPITHRDVLGAVLNLGIERQKLGDIFVNRDFAYVITDKTVSKLILEELKSVGRNKVLVEEADGVPDSFAPKCESKEFSVASNRADAIICKAYNLAREDGSSLFVKGLVTVNGRPCESPSRALKAGDVVTVRGFGKFAFIEEGGLSKKSKLYVSISVYV